MYMVATCESVTNSLYKLMIRMNCCVLQFKGTSGQGNFPPNYMYVYAILTFVVGMWTNTRNHDIINTHACILSISHIIMTC